MLPWLMKWAPQPARRNSPAQPGNPSSPIGVQTAVSANLSQHPLLSAPTRFQNTRNDDASKLFRINTCKTVTKQRALSTFRMNTYAKQGGGGARLLWLRPASPYPAAPPILSARRSRPRSLLPPTSGWLRLALEGAAPWAFSLARSLRVVGLSSHRYLGRL